jgi:hypothetical protein
MFSQRTCRSYFVYTIEMKASPNEWNNHKKEGKNGFVGVFGIQPSSTIEDSCFKDNVWYFH